MVETLRAHGPESILGMEHYISPGVLDGAHNLLNVTPFLLLVVALPCLFRATKDAALDSEVGELSYPIYMCHNFVFGLIAAIPFDLRTALGAGLIWALFNAAAVVTIAFFLDRLVARPIDSIVGDLAHAPAPTPSLGMAAHSGLWRRLVNSRTWAGSRCEYEPRGKDGAQPTPSHCFRSSLKSFFFLSARGLTR